MNHKDNDVQRHTPSESESEPDETRDFDLCDLVDFALGGLFVGS